MPKINKAKIVFLIFMIEAILSLSFFNLYADTQVKPQRPWYSETPNPRHIANYDRLTAEYFNNQLNVIYNWAQNTNAELDNLLHNGIGVASLTVGILNCTNKIINPEWDNLLHNGNGVASITANLVKAQDLEITNSIDVPAIEFSGRSQPAPPVNNGMLYFDSDLQRFRVYQENAWRDLSSNIVIASDSLTSPLVIQGYISASNIYATNSAVINKNLTVKENINSSGTATIQNINILNDSTINRNLTVKGNINSSGTANLKNLNVTDNSTINKNLTVKGRLNASGPAILESLKVNKTLKVPVTASTTLGVGSVYYDTTAGKLKVLNSSNNWDTVGNDIAVDTSMSSTSTNAVQNKVIKSYVDTNTVSAIAQGTDNGTIAVTKNGSTTNVSVKGLGTAAYTASGTYVTAIAKGDNDGTIKVTKNGTATNVSVKGLGSAAYANVASFSAANHTHTYDSELNDTSTNAVQNKKVKEYVDTLSQTITNNYVYNVQEGDSSGTIKITRGLQNTIVKVKGLGDAAFTNVASITVSNSDIASRTKEFFSIASFCQFSNPHLRNDDVVWDTTDLGYSCSFSLYKISNDYKIIKVSIPFGFTQGSPLSSGTYGALIAESIYLYDIQPFINGLYIESITATTQNGDIDVVNARIIKGINTYSVVNPFSVVCDLKSTQLSADNVTITIVFRGYKDN